jgi:hypothetical protein
LVRQTFQLARCGCTLRVTPQTSYSPEYTTPTQTKSNVTILLCCTQEERQREKRKEARKQKKRKLEPEGDIDPEMAAMMGFSGFGGSKK